MLTKDQLIALNNRMLSLGAPVEQDYTGYNKPDYVRMRGLGYMPEITDLMAYAIAESLSHYRNTQLKAEKTEIDKALEYYKEKAAPDIPSLEQDRGMFRTAYTDYCIEHKVHDLIHYVKYDNDYLYLHINGFSKELNNFKDAHKDKIRAVNENGQWDTKIKWDFVNSYIDYAKDAGRGYVPDAELQKFLNEKMQPVLESLAAKAEEPANLKVTVAEADESIIAIDFGEISEDRIKFLKEVKSSLYKSGAASFIKGMGMTLTATVNNMDLDVLRDYMHAHHPGKIAFDEKYDRLCEAFKKFTTPEYNLIVPPESQLPFIPYQFQIDDAKDIISRTRSLIGHEMGLGKTFIAILVGNSIAGKKIVIAPETLRLGWKKEINKVFPGADVKCCTNKNYEIGNDWTIMGYRTAVKYATQLSKEKFNCAFIDEAHKIKAVNNYGNPASECAASVLGICKNIKYVYPMTGTPIPTRNKDLYNLMHLLRSPIAKTFYDYAMDYCAAVKTEYGMNVSGNSNTASLNKYLQEKMARRLKKDVLPDLQKVRRFIPVDVMTKRIKDLESRLYSTADKETFMGLCMTGRNLLSKAKVKAVIEYADELLSEGRSVVIVSAFNETLDEIKKHYEKGSEKAVFIRGGMSDTQKDAAISAFQSGEARVCAMNIIAGGVGVTLTRSHDLIMTDFDWTPANMVQAEDRICRVGQDQLSSITYFYCEGSDMDEYFVDMLTNKSFDIDLAVDNAENTLDLREVYTRTRMQLLPASTIQEESR